MYLLLEPPRRHGLEVMESHVWRFVYFGIGICHKQWVFAFASVSPTNVLTVLMYLMYNVLLKYFYAVLCISLFTNKILMLHSHPSQNATLYDTLGNLGFLVCQYNQPNITWESKHS